MIRTLIAFQLVAATLYAANLPIPRTTKGVSFTEKNVYEGGEYTGATIANLRLGHHGGEKGFERWVFDFQTVEKGAAPRFQVRYEASRHGFAEDGTKRERPARLLVSFRKILDNKLTEKRIAKLVGRSRFVEKIISYPAIEDGDRILEFILKEDIFFLPHQPKKRASRLVIDLKEPS